MATTINLSLRCQSKNLIVGTDGANSVTVSLQSVVQTGTPSMQSSSLTTTVLAAEDTFVMGNMYRVAITDDVPV
jgi:hypothetical protein